METLIIIGIIVFAWLLAFLNNNEDTKFEHAIGLIEKKRLDEAQEVLFNLASKHPLAVTKYAECFLKQAQELQNIGKISDAIEKYNKVLDSKKLLTSLSDKTSFNIIAETAFYEISKLRFDSISVNENSQERIKDLKNNLDFIQNSEFNKSNQIPKLVEKHNEIIRKLYFELGKKEEKNGNFNQAKNDYSNALTYCINKNDRQYFNIIGRIELCKIKLNESIALKNIKQVDKADTSIRNDFYFRYSCFLIKGGKFEDAEKTICSKLDTKNTDVKKLGELIRNEKIKSITNEITSINNQIKKIYNNTASIDLLVSLYDLVTVKGNELNKFVPGILNDLEKLKPSLLNRMLYHYNENNEYGEVINVIINFPEFYNSPLLMKNLGNASFNFLNKNGITTKNYKDIISYFLTSAYSDKVMLSSLEGTTWDDEYTFSLIEAIGSNYILHSEIPENVNYDEISESNISIGEAQKYLLSEFENILNKKVTEYNFQNEVFKFYREEKQAIENVIRIIPNDIVFATPYFAKRFNISNQIIDELEHDFLEGQDEESLKAGIPYLNDNRDLRINDYFEAKKTIDSLIDSINQVDISKFTNSITARRKKLIYKFDTLLESMESRVYDSLNIIAKKKRTDKTVLDLMKKSLNILPNNDKLKHLYSSYASNLCVTLINSDKMTIYKGLQIMSSAYKISPNDLRVCRNIIALIRMNIFDILNDHNTHVSSVYSILDEIKTNRSVTFKNNADELLEARNEILDSLPSAAREAITTGAALNSNGRKLKKALDYLAELGGASSLNGPLAELKEQLDLDLPF